MGRDTLEVMAERSRGDQLAQQVANLTQQLANLTQQLAAQRCVAAFLGSNEKSLHAEIAALRKVCSLVPLCVLPGFALHVPPFDMLWCPKECCLVGCHLGSSSCRTVYFLDQIIEG